MVRLVLTVLVNDLVVVVLMATREETEAFPALLLVEIIFGR